MNKNFLHIKKMSKIYLKRLDVFISPWWLSVCANTGVILYCWFHPLNRLQLGHNLIMIMATIVVIFCMTKIYFSLLLIAKWKILSTVVICFSFMIVGFWFVLIYGFVAEFGHFPNSAILNFVNNYFEYSLIMITESINSGFTFLIIFFLICSLIYSFIWQKKTRKQFNFSKKLIFYDISGMLIGLTFILMINNSLGLKLQTDNLVINRMKLPKFKIPVNATQPNIILFRWEETSKKKLGLYGYSVQTTPNLARFKQAHSREFFIFQNHRANSGATDVALTLLYSGLFPTRSGKDMGAYPLIWDYAKAADYHTFLIQPFHLTWGEHHIKYQSTPGVISLDYLVDADKSKLPLTYDRSIRDDQVIDIALNHLKLVKKNRPFFGIISLKLPHHNGSGVKTIGYDHLSCNHAETHLNNYECSIYEVDFQISRILQYLKKKNMLESTILINVADHGADQGIRRHRLLNYYNEVLAIPFFVYIPKKIQGVLDKKYPNWRTNTNKNTSNADLVPTFIDLLNISKYNPIPDILSKLDGSSVFSPTTKSAWMEALNTNALRSWEPEGFALIYHGRYKYIFDAGHEFLFDLKQDSNEHYNLLQIPQPKKPLIYLQVVTHISKNPILSRIFNAH